MSKNLCPENNVTFETSYQIKFETPLPDGTYTCSAVIESTDTDSASCLMLFYYADGSTKELYITRKPGERVFKTVELAQDSTRVRIYASEGHSLSSGDTATYSQLQIEAGSEMTDYMPYEDEPESEEDVYEEFEVIAYWIAMSGLIPVTSLTGPSCRETILIRKILDSTYEVPFTNTNESSRTEKYLWDLVNGTGEMLTNIPKSDKEKYLHLMIGGTVLEEDMPDPDACELNYWLNKTLEAMNS